MPLQLIRSASNEALWDECVTQFFDELGGHTGPLDYATHLWVVHRAQRDRLYERATARGLAGWFRPPVAFFSQLRDAFAISEMPIGILTGRLLVARLATESARQHGLVAATREAGPARGHMLDRLFSELLPEGVTPEGLESALAALQTDEFGERRNAWVGDTYRAFLEALAQRERYDPRSIHAKVAERIEAGGLRSAIGGARRLHVYGLTSLRGRRRLIQALASQTEVEVVVYLPTEPTTSEWDDLAGEPTRVLPTTGKAPEVRVQPTPDAVREGRWVARRIKTILSAGDVSPHEVVVVARTGRQDTRRLHRALHDAGVPSTVRVRTRLAEIPALRSVLELFRAASEGWTYRGLRQVLASPYFEVEIDLRGIDHLSTVRRIHGLEEWTEWLSRLQERAQANEPRALAQVGISGPQIARDIAGFERFRESTGVLEGEHTEREWIDCTLALLRGEPFNLRGRLSDPVADRWDVVRLDQRGVLALESLLVEWGQWPGVRSARSEFDVGEWYARLRRLLEANELALSTPVQQGVQVLEAHEAASTPFRHTFLIHANDGVFPQPPATAGVFTEQERRALKELGLPLATREEALERERRLWWAIVGASDVTVTYRTTDAHGTPRLASPLVPDHDSGTELPRTRLEGVGSGHAEQGEAPASQIELVQREVARFGAVRRGGDRAPFSIPDPHALRHAVLMAFADELRSGHLDPFVDTEREVFTDDSKLPAPIEISEDSMRVDSAAAAALFALKRPLSEQPTAWNGKLRDPWLLGHLQRRFGEDRQWSPTQLETYGRRPFDFFLARVLGLGDQAEADEETSALTYGSIAHAILERFYRSLGGQHPGTFDAVARNRFAEAFTTVCDEYERAADAWLGVPHVWRAKRAELRDRVTRFLEWELEKAPGVPVELELAFGRGRNRPAVDLSGPDVHGEEQRLILGGRIDRVDRCGSGDPVPVRVIDYKSGSSVPALRSYQDGAGLQTALYLAAVQQLGIGTPVEGVYRALKKRSNQSKLKASSMEEVVQLARSIPARVRRGLFEAVQADSTKIAPWQPGPDITRSAARVSGGTRFDPVAGTVVWPAHAEESTRAEESATNEESATSEDSDGTRDPESF
jgi:RecB family exonuclease